MTTKQAAELYVRAGRMPPADIAAPSAEHIRNTRRKAVDGIPFRSTLEANAYQVLKSWRRAGAIAELQLQPRFVLQPRFFSLSTGTTIRAMTYRADFSYTQDGQLHVIEAKGFRTEAYRMRRKLFLAKYPDAVFEEWTQETLRDLMQ